MTINDSGHMHPPRASLADARSAGPEPLVA
jgi:hypothetical protein